MVTECLAKNALQPHTFHAVEILDKFAVRHSTIMSAQQFKPEKSKGHLNDSLKSEMCQNQLYERFGRLKRQPIEFKCVTSLFVSEGVHGFVCNFESNVKKLREMQLQGVAMRDCLPPSLSLHICLITHAVAPPMPSHRRHHRTANATATPILVIMSEKT